MKKKILPFLLALCMAASLSTTAWAVFPDVDENAEYAEAVEYLDEIDIMSGDQYGNFNPDNTVTRAEMATIVCRLLGETEDLPSDDRFPDVPVGHWANGYVSKAAELGIVTGYDTGLFGPTDEVTYEQAVTIIMRTMGMEDFAQISGGYPDGYLTVADEGGYLANLSLEKGDYMSRANVAVLLFNCYGYV